MEAARFLEASRWRLAKRWPPWPSRKRDRRSMRQSIATGAKTHGPKLSACSEPEHAMDFRTKIFRTNISRTNISPSQADRAAIFRLSWHGFLVCAFAVMTFLAWATLRQALGAEPNATGPQGRVLFAAGAEWRRQDHDATHGGRAAAS